MNICKLILNKDFLRPQFTMEDNAVICTYEREHIVSIIPWSYIEFQAVFSKQKPTIIQGIRQI